MFDFKRFFLFFLIFVSNVSFADDYYFWYPKQGPAVGHRFSDPASACSATIRPPFSYVSLTYVNSSYFQCVGLNEKTGNTYPYSINRGGSYCPPNTNYNKNNGECVTDPDPEPEPEPEPNKCEVGEITSHLFPTKNFDGFYVTLAPQQMCQNSCVVNQVTTSSGTKGCIPFAEGRYCFAQFAVTDEKCDVNDDLPQAPQIDENAAIDPKDEDQEDGTKSEHCVLYTDSEGRQSYKCNPPPEQGHCPDGWLVGADGSTCYRDPGTGDPNTGGGNDGGSTGEGGGGNDGGSTGEGGEGSEGGEQGDVLKKFDENNKLLADIKKAIQDKPVGGGGAGGGDGSHNNPDKDKGSVSGGDGCDSEPTCVGDVIQCAILSQNHKSRCEAKELADFQKHKDDISSLFEGEEFQIPVGEDIEVESFLTGHTRWLPSNCPRPERVTLGTNGQSLSLSYDPMCKLANSLSPLIIILATLFATVYIGRSSGG